MIKHWQTELIIFYQKTCWSIIQCLLHNSSRTSYNELKIWIYRFFMVLFHFYQATIGVKFFESMVLLANVRYCRGPSLNYIAELSLLWRNKNKDELHDRFSCRDILIRKLLWTINIERTNERCQEKFKMRRRRHSITQESQFDLQIRSFSIGSASDFIGIRHFS